MQKWWAQYLESLGEMESARSYYQQAGDFLSVVRICCFMGDMDRVNHNKTSKHQPNNHTQAAAIANESGDKAACYHLARTYENSGQISAAVNFFTKAHAYTSALRLAKVSGISMRITEFVIGTRSR